PLDAHTGDASFIECFEAVVPELTAAFRPDVIVLQAGCDAHAWDPLTHLRCSTNLYWTIVRNTVALADEHCGGRLIVTGGGGYAIHTVVPRAWTLVWAALCGQSPPDPLPEDWLKALRLEAGSEVPLTLRDPVDAIPPSPRGEMIAENNRR